MQDEQGSLDNWRAPVPQWGCLSAAVDPKIGRLRWRVTGQAVDSWLCGKQNFFFFLAERIMWYVALAEPSGPGCKASFSSYRGNSENCQYIVNRRLNEGFVNGKMPYRLCYIRLDLSRYLQLMSSKKSETYQVLQYWLKVV